MEGLWQSLAETLFHDTVVVETEASKKLLEFYVSHRNWPSKTRDSVWEFGRFVLLLTRNLCLSGMEMPK